MDDTSRDAELENYLDALNDFVKKPSKSIPSVLEQLIQRIARHGEPLFPWFKLKPLIVMKLENVIEEYIEYNPHEEVPILPNVENVRFDDMRERLLKALESFNSAPFTIQRLCELLTEPKRYYRRSDKFMRGIEKNVQVVSTITPSGKRITSLFELNKSPPMMNGIVPDPEASPTSDNNGFVRPDSDAFTSSPSSSNRVDAMNGVGRPYYNAETMDAPLQFAYPLGQSLTSPVTSMPSSDSSLRTDLNRLNGSPSETHEAEAKETSEAMADGASQDSVESNNSRVCDERTLGGGEDNIDNDTASVVSSSDAESFIGDSQSREDGEDEMEVDVASSGDAAPGRDGETEQLPLTEQGKEGSGDVSTSESTQASGELSRELDEAGKADSSEGTGASTPMDCREELSTNSEAASSEHQSTVEEEAGGSDHQRDQTNASVASPEEGVPDADVGAAGDAGPGDALPGGDAGPADSSNDASSMPIGASEEITPGSSEADSKASSPETPAAAPLEASPTPDPVAAVESSADATTARTPSSDPPTDGVTDSTPSDSTPSSDSSRTSPPDATSDPDTAASSGELENIQVCDDEQPQSAEGEPTQS